MDNPIPIKPYFGINKLENPYNNTNEIIDVIVLILYFPTAGKRLP